MAMDEEMEKNQNVIVLGEEVRRDNATQRPSCVPFCHSMRPM